MHLLVSEILDKFEVAKTREEKIAVLQNNVTDPFGGAPNDVFNASLCFGLPSGPITGIVWPGLIHWFKKVNLAFNPSGVVEWKAGLKYLIFSLMES